MLKLIMVLLWMILLVVLLCVTEVRGELGTNVTLTCSNQSPDTYWYMEIYTQFKGYIGRSHSSTSFCSPGFETKFSIVGNKVVIKNLTAEDCRLYFCGINKKKNINFTGTFHVVSCKQKFFLIKKIVKFAFLRKTCKNNLMKFRKVERTRKQLSYSLLVRLLHSIYCIIYRVILLLVILFCFCFFKTIYLLF
uniref:Immunoglobulin domain-containing protein n=1 Tax=Oreochromis aureus TaxID=47969 RepID=A0AAZ1XER7_OREAU